MSLGKGGLLRWLFSAIRCLSSVNTRLCVPCHSVSTSHWVCVPTAAFLPVSIQAASQGACAFYWASQNRSGPSAIVCLCVTDTSKSGGKASLAARAVSQPNLQFSVWLASMTILSAVYSMRSYVCVCLVWGLPDRHKGMPVSTPSY